jgi:chromosome segregation ATPase|tara:strand:- start:5456 stop:5932 length:477 start_codon:yes stop_codon:yes gene_type:complete
MFIFGILKKYLIIAGVLGAVGFGLWKYYTYTQETIRVYAENAARAEMAQAETQAALEQTIKDLEKVQEKYNQVSADFNSAKKRVDGLQDKLKEHDLPFLAEQKPGLVEKILDKGSKDMLRCLEIISGSPLTEEELNVTTKSKANTQCPDLANPNYIPN